MTISFLIDHRETALIAALRTLEAPITIAPLDIGDIEIRSEEPSFTLLFERKTLADLHASVKDGRYHEQKARLTNTTQPHHCTYLIENPHHWNSVGMNEAMYAGCLIHTMYRDGMHMIITRSTEDTAQWLYQIWKKCTKHPEKFVTAVATQYTECRKIKTKKIENIDPRTCYELQWAQIPGISAKIAKEIVKVYPSWPTFYRAMDEQNTVAEKIQILTTIPMVGRKKAEKIWEYLGSEGSGI